MLGVQLRSQWGFNHQPNISVSSHRSTARLATPLPIGSSPETTFWNIVFCGDYLMFGVEPQRDVKQFRTHPGSRWQRVHSEARDWCPSTEIQGDLSQTFLSPCFPRWLIKSTSQRARFDSIWPLPHKVTVKNQVVSIVHVIPVYWYSSIRYRFSFGSCFHLGVEKWGEYERAERKCSLCSHYPSQW